MTILEVLYGSQYAELKEKGIEISKGRIYGNLLFAAFIIVVLLIPFVSMSLISSDISDEVTRSLRKTFGVSSGKMIGQIIAVPLLVGIYFVVSKVVGSERKYEQYYQTYTKASDEEKKEGMVRMFIVFFSAIGLLTILAISSLFI